MSMRWTKPWPNSRERIVVIFLALIVALLVPVPPAFGESAAWLQWGGPDRNFRAAAAELAEEWPEGGPTEKWSRELGDGYSTVLVEGDRLFTMYRGGDKEVVIALDAKSGKTLWEHGYDSGPGEGHVAQFGSGPRATPLISGGRIYTIGISGLMHSLHTKDGVVAWSQDLWRDFGGNFLNHGYASSPIEYGDTVIALVGGEGQSIVAFNKEDGSVAWKALSFKNSYSAPQILKVGNQDQLVTFMAEELIGVDPSNGALLWRYPIANQWQQNINMPSLVEGRFLFVSSIQAGSHGLELIRKEDKTEVKEVWSTRKIQFYHQTTVLDGEWVYGTTGSGAVQFMSAINVKTGEIAWRKRGFAKANLLAADGKLLILDEDGKLYLATANPGGLTVHAEAEILDKVAWSTPTVVGNILYVRDKKTIKALNLG